MNTHKELELLSAYLDQRLPSMEKETLESHLHSCVNCSAELKRIESLKNLLRKLPQKPMPAALITRIEANASEKLNKKTWADWLTTPRIWVPAAGLCLGILFILGWLKSVAIKENEIPAEIILAAHQRYLEESSVSHDRHGLHPIAFLRSAV